MPKATDIRITGGEPFEIFTNAKLNIWLVGESYKFATQVTYRDKQGRETEYFRLTPKLLGTLRQQWSGKNTDATRQFAQVLKQYWKPQGE